MKKFLGTQFNNYRFVVISLIVVIWFVVYLQRINISMLLVDTEFLRDMGLIGKNGMQGLLMTFFLLPYALTNIVSAPLGDKIGPRKTMLIGIGISVMGTFFSGIAMTFAWLLAARLVLGIGQGIHFPNQSSFVKNWFPANERGLGNALCAVGGCAAPMLAIPIYSWLVGNLGWKYAVMSIGILALVVSLPLILKWITDTPADSAYVTQAECDYIMETPVAGLNPDEAEKGSVGEVVRSFDFWLLSFSYLAYLAIWWGLVTWLPQYFAKARGFDMHTMSWATSVPYATAIVAVILGAIVSDRLGKRSLINMIAFIGAALCIILSATVNSPLSCVILVSAGVGLTVIVYPISWAILQSMMPAQLIGTGSGIMNGCGNLLSALTPFAVGLLIELTGTYNAGMFLLAGFAILGAGCSMILLQRHK